MPYCNLAGPARVSVQARAGNQPPPGFIPENGFGDVAPTKAFGFSSTTAASNAAGLPSQAGGDTTPLNKQRSGSGSHGEDACPMDIDTPYRAAESEASSFRYVLD